MIYAYSADISFTFYLYNVAYIFTRFSIYSASIVEINITQNCLTLWRYASWNISARKFVVTGFMFIKLPRINLLSWFSVEYY